MSKSVPTIQGMIELRRRLQAVKVTLPATISAELQDGANAIAAEAKQRAPGDQGILRNLISAAKIDPLQFEVVSGAEYSPFLEFGTGAKVSIPPGLEEYAAQFKGDFASGTYSEGSGLTAKEAIFAWCERQGIEKELWYAIYVSVMTNGINPHPFFFPAVNRITPIIIDRVNKALDKVI